MVPNIVRRIGWVNPQMEAEMDTECKTVSVEEAGIALGYSKNSAYAAVRSGELPVIRLGKKMRVPKIALDRLLGAGHPRTGA